ncbi:MAG: apolipoprotein N-acyltransferase [Ruminococcaceae bacterium]|nr:apolipoprotein N-acyltransferase [Oscillospiraceae bacterium]
MVLTEKRYMRFLLLALGGVLTGLTLVFPAVGFFQWLTLIPVGLFLLEHAVRPTVRLRSLYGYGLFFFLCYYIVVFHWFVNLYPLDFIDGMTKGAALSVVLVAWLGLSLLQALFGGLLFVAAGLVFRSSLSRRVPFLRPFFGAGLWAIYEWTQTLGWWGVPWGRLPLGQAKYLIGLQTASWFGSYFVTFLLVAVNFCAAFALCAYLTSPKTAWMPVLKRSCLAIAAILVFQYGAGTALWLSQSKQDLEARTVTAAAIQGNFSSNEKWSFDSTKRTKEVYREYTLRAAAEGAKIVVWPETALPYPVYEGSALYKYVSALAVESQTTILVGAFSIEEGGGEYNSILYFLPDGSMHDTVYSKRRLVPFGEFVPFRRLIETVIPPLAELVMSGEDVLWGEGSQIVALEEGNVGSLICFDSIYEDLTRESVLDGAELLCLSTNDSWFTDSAALYMHNAQAQLRAIESGRYVVRSANTGISTVISHRGEVLSELAPLTDGMLVEEVELRQETTLYTAIGNSFVYLLLLAFGAILLYDGIRRASVTVLRKFGDKRKKTS